MDAGRPREGLTYDSLKSAKQEVKQYLNLCKAREERKRIQSRDVMVKTNDPRRFKLPRKQQAICNKLYVDGVVYKDTGSLLECWQNYFRLLGKSTGSDNGLENIVDCNLLHESSKANDDSVLDYDINMEEVEYTVASMRSGKSSGPNCVSAEHLKYGGPGVVVW